MNIVNLAFTGFKLGFDWWVKNKTHRTMMGAMGKLPGWGQVIASIGLFAGGFISIEQLFVALNNHNISGTSYLIVLALAFCTLTIGGIGYLWFLKFRNKFFAGFEADKIKAIADAEAYAIEIKAKATYKANKIIEGKE
jgi:hypothetical protein